jgi:hypothetical protein
MPTHFKGNRRYLYEFSDLFLVHCPRCDKCARIVPRDRQTWDAGGPPYTKYMFAPRRLTCEYCGYVKEWEGKRVGVAGANDWYFGQPLWLQANCSGELLWAINQRHLQFMEDFVRADFRETHWNATLASRLPEWMKLGKNREDVLKCITRLRELLVSGDGR